MTQCLSFPFPYTPEIRMVGPGERERKRKEGRKVCRKVVT